MTLGRYLVAGKKKHGVPTPSSSRNKASSVHVEIQVLVIIASRSDAKPATRTMNEWP